MQNLAAKMGRVISRTFSTLALCLAFLLPLAARAQQQPLPDGKPHSFAVASGQFQLDGKPFRIVSGEMHYPRIPREYWRARLRMAKAMGLNAITTYVFWNVHEPTPGTYDFSGQNDVAEFIREAQQEGLWVILRPGPYVCAEWEFGGYPAWLLKDPTIKVRTSDPAFMQPATRWLKRLGQELAPLQAGNGGPILLVQVENEYGSYGSDHAYMEQVHQAIAEAGFTKAQLYTADGPGDVPNGSLPELPVGINFDGNKPGEAEKSFAKLKGMRPDGPFFNSEFWAGWFDHWGGQHAHTDTAAQTANLKWILDQGYSVSIYMFEGGTDFGWMNGANSSDTKKDYQPDVTSYDYDAALDESGRPTPKFYAFRDAIAQATGVTPPPVPQVAAPIAIAPIHFTQAASLWANLPKPITSDRPLTMEAIGQNYGWILYRTRLPRDSWNTGTLTVHDFACVYVNQHVDAGEAAASYTSNPMPQLPTDSLPCQFYERLKGAVQVRQFGSRVSMLEMQGDEPFAEDIGWELLVENQGRINYSHQFADDRKGIVAWKPPANPAIGPTKWFIYPFPMDNVTSMHFKKTLCNGPCFYRGSFNVDAPADTFLDTSQLTRGQLWINGHAMGRFWNIGPQKTLYIPGPWLKQGANDIIVFDVDGHSSATVQGLTKPDLGN